MVICGTSLDHCLSLNKSLQEIKRILKPGGKCLVRVGFIQGSIAYNPKLPNLVSVDDYHLFHFDKPWFESLMAQYFKLLNSINFGVEGSFYVFES